MLRETFRRRGGRWASGSGDRRRDAELRAHSRRLLHRLAPSLPLGIAELCELLAEQRGTPITLLEWELPADGPFGVLLSRPDEDVIVYQANTTKAHQAHIVLHEIGHIIAYDLAGERPELPLLRTCYSDRDERDAEVVASTLMHQAMSMHRQAQRYGLDEPWRPSVFGSLVFEDGLR
ncbi:MULTISPECIES: hypothetical protein [Streptomyces]|uniref:IrrE N-terminal-like domain-containing protein n=1 Tax=Streptomyces sviceus (strain ATCC 29083 / DSM 924 / JCM 4929 / NBRC 13980 / NCIMB 11184 / NRRL 5439 / UC 5370) TaxID=463191 RepID=B5HR72_STRX2|nr:MULTISPECIES: hypothetical protein [Streptomyces]EDY55328.1 conserved hypothetical protein [Streptomyces sviceus ATCC 29083]MYT09211.1 hypothetical protein [Streptomyces sp. SID5470]